VHKTVVINAVGLTPALISAEHAPNIHALRAAGSSATIGAVIPAVTTTVQSTYLTGKWPSEHGIVGNGWYFRDTAEVRFWLQSNHLVQAPPLWIEAKQRDAKFTCANLFWWYAMYSAADVTVTPRPMYPADGRKLPDVWTNPPGWRDDLQRKLGQFPLFHFWGPATSIKSTQWIADAAIETDKRFDCTLTLIYLPHLDYVLQREDPRLKPRRDLRELDEVVGKILRHFQGARIMLLSEYGIAPVSRPVHLNRVLRNAGLLVLREELGREILDAGASAAFAVADHQVAHVYVSDERRLDEVKRLLESAPGVARVLDDAGKRELHLDHPRAGDLVCLAERDSWFTYYFWQDDARAPDYARTVDIHRKPGYDPCELFIDPKLPAAKLRIAWALAKKKLGFRTLMNVIPVDATLVKGSHGLAATDPEHGPLLISTIPTTPTIQPTDVKALILRSVFE
jgi:predicted AlkP superfamily pyrophosphatase or phosphodiesterase